jgi:hypothetical protein
MKISRAVENGSECCNRYENTYQLCPVDHCRRRSFGAADSGVAEYPQLDVKCKPLTQHNRMNDYFRPWDSWEAILTRGTKDRKATLSFSAFRWFPPQSRPRFESSASLGKSNLYFLTHY